MTLETTKEHHQKNSYKRTTLCFAFILLMTPLSSLSSAAQEKGPIVVVTGGFEAVRANHKIENLKGPNTDAVRKFLEERNIPNEIKTRVWSRAYNIFINNKNTLAYPLTRTLEREDKFYWLKKLSTQRYNILGVAGEFAEDITLKEITTGNYFVICGDLSVSCNMAREFGFREENIIKVTGTYVEEMVRRVVAGRASFMIENYESIQLGITTNPDLAKKIKKVGNFEIAHSMYLAANKTISPALLKTLTDSP